MTTTFINHKPNKYESVIDHIDENKLNNREDNLQLISHRENISKGFKNKGTSKFTGVSWNNENKKWQSFIRIPKGKNINLGSFDTDYRASIAYQFALLQINNIKYIMS